MMNFLRLSRQSLRSSNVSGRRQSRRQRKAAVSIRFVVWGNKCSGRLQNQVGCAELPWRIVNRQRGRRVRRIAYWYPVRDPIEEHLALCVGDSVRIPEISIPRNRLPRRHRFVCQDTLDVVGISRDVIIGEQRHGRNLVRLMTLLASSLHQGQDVFVKGSLRGKRRTAQDQPRELPHRVTYSTV